MEILVLLIFVCKLIGGKRLLQAWRGVAGGQEHAGKPQLVGHVPLVILRQLLLPPNILPLTLLKRPAVLISDSTSEGLE